MRRLGLSVLSFTLSLCILLAGLSCSTKTVLKQDRPGEPTAATASIETKPTVEIASADTDPVFSFPRKEEQMRRIMAQSGIDEKASQLTSADADERLEAAKAIRLSGRKDQISSLRKAIAVEEDSLALAEMKRTIVALQATPRPTPTPVPTPAPPAPTATPKSTPAAPKVVASATPPTKTSPTPSVKIPLASEVKATPLPMPKQIAAATPAATPQLKVDMSKLPVLDMTPAETPKPMMATSAPRLTAKSTPKPQTEGRSLWAKLTGQKPKTTSEPKIVATPKVTTKPKADMAKLMELAEADEPPMISTPAPTPKLTPRPRPTPRPTPKPSLLAAPKTQTEGRSLWAKLTGQKAKAAVDTEARTAVAPKSQAPVPAKQSNGLDVLNVEVAAPILPAGFTRPMPSPAPMARKTVISAESAKPSFEKTSPTAIPLPSAKPVAKAAPQVSEKKVVASVNPPVAPANKSAAPTATPLPSVQPIAKPKPDPDKVVAKPSEGRKFSFFNRESNSSAPASHAPQKSTGGVQLKVLSSGMEPAKAQPGQIVQLKLAYEVSGLPDGKTAIVVDERSISYAGQTSSLKPNSIERSNGRWSYRGIIRLPDTLKPGQYTISCRLSSGGKSEEITLPLEVAAQPGKKIAETGA